MSDLNYSEFLPYLLSIIKIQWLVLVFCFRWHILWYILYNDRTYLMAKRGNNRTKLLNNLSYFSNKVKQRLEIHGPREIHTYSFLCDTFPIFKYIHWSKRVELESFKSRNLFHWCIRVKELTNRVKIETKQGCISFKTWHCCSALFGLLV